MNLKIRAVLFGVIIACLSPKAADAACGALPYVFTNAVSTVSATTTNANNNFLLACAKNVDNSQVGSGGLFASQIIPTNSTQATFSGTQSYIFPYGVQGNASNTAGYFPPVYTFAGAATASTEHAVRQTATVTIANGQVQGSTAVSLVGAAAFSSSSSYQVLLTWNAGGSTLSGITSTNFVPAIQISSGSAFTIYVNSATASVGTSTFSLFVYAAGS